MAGFLYYFPDHNQVSRQEFADKIPYAQIKSTPFARTCTGPDGGSGCVCADGERVDISLVRYDPSTQKWIKAPGVGLWVGYYTNNDSPSPADLELSNQLSGHAVTLADGRDWLCPVARLLDGSKCVPTVMGFDGVNWAENAVVQEYALIWDYACKWLDWIVSEEEQKPELPKNDFMNMVVSCLSANYAIGIPEVTVLGLLTMDNSVSIMNALIDVPSRIALQKKTVQEG